MIVTKELVVIFASVLLTGALKLPSLVERCSIRDPDIGSCMMKTANKLIPEMAKGLPKYDIPPLDPFHIDKIDIEATSALKVSLTDCNILGLAKGVFTKFWADVTKRVGYFTLFVDKLELSAQYDVQGKILFVPITGNGHGNLTLMNATFLAKAAWDVVHNPKDDTDYFKFVEFNVKYDMDRIYAHLDNLFNGNKELGDNMNKFLNENWREFARDIEPSIGKTIGQVLLEVINRFFAKVPAADWYLP